MRSKMLDFVVSLCANLYSHIYTVIYIYIYHILSSVIFVQPRRQKLAEVNTIHINTAISACKHEKLEVARGFLARMLGLSWEVQ